MRPQPIDFRQRFLLAASALAACLVLAMLQCPLLSIDAAWRSGLSAFAAVVSALGVAALLEDLALRPLVHALRRWREGRPSHKVTRRAPLAP